MGKPNSKAAAESGFLSGLTKIEKHRIDTDYTLEMKRMERHSQDKKEERAHQLAMAKVQSDMIQSMMAAVMGARMAPQTPDMAPQTPHSPERIPPAPPRRSPRAARSATATSDAGETLAALVSRAQK